MIEWARIGDRVRANTQLDTSWGVKPTWAKKLLINGKSETVSTKPTFKSAIISGRCLIPCSGWYEWRNEGKPKKAKYLFTPSQGNVIYIAGIVYFENVAKSAGVPFAPNSPIQSVSLTTRPNNICADFHHRMPAIIEQQNVEYWFRAQTTELPQLFEPVDNRYIKIQVA